MNAPTAPAPSAPRPVATYGPPCPGCSRPRGAADARGLAWSSEHAADGSVSWTCPGCTRAALTDIETGVPGPGRRRTTT